MILKVLPLNVVSQSSLHTKMCILSYHLKAEPLKLSDKVKFRDTLMNMQTRRFKLLEGFFVFNFFTYKQILKYKRKIRTKYQLDSNSHQTTDFYFYFFKSSSNMKRNLKMILAEFCFDFSVSQFFISAFNVTTQLPVALTIYNSKATYY